MYKLKCYYKNMLNTKVECFFSIALFVLLIITFTVSPVFLSENGHIITNNSIKMIKYWKTFKKQEFNLKVIYIFKILH